MKFLAIDTSGRRLVVAAVNGAESYAVDEDCAMQHSVRLMDAVGEALKGAHLTLGACDFLACGVGPGSFTGIRIGISTCKGLCFAAEKPALAVTSFESIAYADRGDDSVAAVDAGHGFVYAKGFGAAGELGAGYYTREAAEQFAARTKSVFLLGVPTAAGLVAAARAECGRAGPARGLAAVYCRRSSAEEGR